MVPVSTANSKLVVLIDATTIRELIVDVVEVSGCMLLSVLGIFWMHRSEVIESVDSVTMLNSAMVTIAQL